MGLRDRIHDIRTMHTLFTAAETEAQRMGEDAAGAEHLVLAALDLPDGSARRALHRVGSDADGFRAAVVGQHAEALRAIGVDSANAVLDAHIPEPPDRPTGPVRTTTSAHTLFSQVVDRVRAERSRLHGAWIVLVATESDHGSTARALRYMGVDRAALATAAWSELDLLD